MPPFPQEKKSSLEWGCESLGVRKQQKLVQAIVGHFVQSKKSHFPIFTVNLSLRRSSRRKPINGKLVRTLESAISVKKLVPEESGLAMGKNLWGHQSIRIGMRGI